MCELGGEPSGGVQLAFPRGKFRGLLGGTPLALQQHLHPITAGRQQPQHEQPRQIGLNAGFLRGGAERQIRRFYAGSAGRVENDFGRRRGQLGQGNLGVQNARADIKNAEQQVQHDLRCRQRYADGVQNN